MSTIGPGSEYDDGEELGDDDASDWQECFIQDLYLRIISPVFSSSFQIDLHQKLVKLISRVACKQRSVMNFSKIHQSVFGIACWKLKSWCWLHPDTTEYRISRRQKTTTPQPEFLGSTTPHCYLSCCFLALVSLKVLDHKFFSYY